MDIKLELPTEIWSIIFQDLEPQDLVNCSRSCWSCNSAANSLLYETVSFSSHAKLVYFVESISSFQTSHVICVDNSIDIHQPLGQLVKSVEIIAGYTQEDDRHNYSTMLSRLASKTPNIHSARINVPILFSNADSGSSFNWSTLASQWSKLTTLSLSDLPSPYINETYDISNISDVFHRLQHLDITRCDGIRTHMLPTMPYLQTLAACIDHASDYNALPKILQSCQNTLHTLFIRFECYDDRAPPNSFNLDDLNIGHKQLKTFGLYSMDGSQFNITEFGDNLEHLGWCVHNFLEMDPSLPPAMIKKDTLKSLSFAGNMDPDCAALVLEANKYSLQTLYFEDTDLIDALQESKVRLYNVTTLCCISSSLENSDVCSLAEIFPNVKYLALCRKKYPTLKGTGRPMWIAMDSLSHFQHLEALDIMTFLELVDQSLSTFQQCKILGPVWKGPYLVIPLQESRGRYLCHMFH